MMSKFNDLLNLRFKNKTAPSTKVAALIERSNNGELSSFSGVFRVLTLSDKEKETIENILKTFRANDAYDIHSDLHSLFTLTSEVKAIANQAVILHGERIKKAQEVLKKYRDGAFTAWLYATYGNRQTPYNFLQYYELYTTVPSSLHVLIDRMPRQAVYSLASRTGSTEKKEEIIKNYSGQTKQELLQVIRTEFPLAEADKRQPNLALCAIQFLKKARDALKNSQCSPSEAEKKEIKQLLSYLQKYIYRT